MSRSRWRRERFGGIDSRLCLCNDFRLLLGIGGGICNNTNRLSVGDVVLLLV